MHKYKDVKKRGLAIALALLTVLTTWSTDLTVLAQSYSEVGQVGGNTLSSGGQLAEVFTSESSYEKLEAATFKLEVPQGTTISYTVSVYQNLTDETKPDSGALSFMSEIQTYVGSAQSATELTVDFAALGVECIFSQGETYAVVLTLSSSSGNIIYYEGTSNNNGFRRDSVQSSMWETRQNMIAVSTSSVDELDDVTAIKANTVNRLGTAHISLSETEREISVDVTPSYKRDVTFEGGTGNGTVFSFRKGTGNTVIVKPLKSGYGEVYAVCGSTRQKIELYIQGFSISGSATYEYTGEEIKPNVTWRNLNGETILAPSGMLVYNNNINVGEATVTVPGILDYPEVMHYQITPKAITQDQVTAGDYIIDTRTSQVTGGIVPGLNFGTDYTATAEYRSASPSSIVYTVTVTGKGNFSGTYTTTETIIAGEEGNLVDINDVVTAELSQTKYTYDQTYKEPQVTFYGTDGSEVANFADNCTIAYKNNINSGTATVTITGESDAGYTGTITKTFSISKCRISSNSNVTISLNGGTDGTFPHTGGEVEPEVLVRLRTDSGATYDLVEDTDYTLLYTNNTEIGTATVKISGKSNFAGTVTKYFDIIGDFEKDTIVDIGDSTTDFSEGYASAYEATYTGRGIEPEIYVTLGVESLNEGVDYSVEYINNVNAGEATAVITGLGPYEGKTLHVTYTIHARRISSPLVVTGDDRIYTGSPVALEAGEYAITGLTEDVDYTISYRNNVNAGTATIVATGINNYTGTVSTTFGITPRVISDGMITVEAIEDQTYTGSAITPDLVVSYNGQPLTSADYIVNYSKNVTIGQADVTITGRGNLTGSRVEHFTIKAKTMESLSYWVEGAPVTPDELGNLMSTYQVAYTGLEHKPNVTVMDQTTVLRPFTDYTLSYTKDINCGTAEITITGAGAYEGSRTTVGFTITPKDINDAQIIMEATGETYKDGANTLPRVSIVDTGILYGNRTLIQGTSYTITPTEGCDTSGANKTAVITGTGNYGGTRTVTYTIGKDISGASVALSSPFDKTAYTQQDNGYYYVTYMGPGATPRVDVTCNGSLLTTDDYDIRFKSLTEANGNDIYTALNDNTIQVTITGKGDYYGEKVIQYIVVEASLDKTEKYIVTNKDTEHPDFSYTYNGQAFEIALNVSYRLAEGNLVPLEEGIDYTLSTKTFGPDCVDATVVLSGQGNYQGTMTVTFRLGSPSLGDAQRISITEIEDQEYTGAAITPDFVVKDILTDKILELGTDYSVRYSNNVAVGRATIYVTGMGNYQGTGSVRFNITSRTLSDSSKISITPIDNQTYTGSALEPDVAIYYGTTLLVPGEDYDCTYTNNVNPGQASVTINGKGTYAGDTATNFNIIGNINNATLFHVNGVNESYHLANGVLNFSDVGVSITYNEDHLWVDPSNYTITQENCTAPGMGRLVFIGKNYCTGTRVVNIKVIGDLSEATVTEVRDAYDYTGASITPEPRVTYGTKTLIPGSDYTVSYGENKLAGVAAGSIRLVAVEGSNYTGSKTKPFDIKYNLEDAVVTGPGLSYDYVGSDITPAVNTVTVNGKQLLPGDYSVAYNNNANAGTAQITLTPNREYVTGSKVINFTINGISLLGATVSLEGQTGTYSTAYTGDEIQPNVAVTCNGRLLTPQTDYTLQYTNNINKGTANVRVLGNGNYSGAVDRSFEITTKDINSTDVAATVATADYAGGEAVTPEFSLTYNGRTLVAGTDYTYQVSNNTDVTGVSESRASITFTGINNFRGTRTERFNIIQTDLTKGSIIVDATSTVYTGNPCEPNIVVQCPLGNGSFYTLKKGQDYEVTFGTSVAQMIEADTYNIRITGKGNFINSLNTSYTILPKPVTSEDVQVNITDVDYTGQAVTPTVTVRDTTRGKDLILGTDYSVQVMNNTVAGSAHSENPPTVIVNGMNNYGESVETYFNIGKTVEDAQIGLSQTAYTYDGNEHTPAVTVSYEGNPLTEGMDYTCQYQEDVTNAGRKTVTITSMGKYYGIVEKEYVIHRKLANSGKIRLELNLPRDEAENYIVTYMGEPLKPQVTVYDEEISNTIPLRAEDYQVEYVNNNVVGTAANPAYAVVTLKGNYDIGADTYRVPFVIKERDITDTFTVWMSDYRYSYTGEEIVPEVAVTSQDGLGNVLTLRPQIDYDVEITDNVNAGRATLTVTGKGNYSGKVTTSFDIYASLTTAQVIIDRQFTTGEPVYPPVTVICGGNTLEAGVDYNVAYYSDDDYTTSGYVIITPLTTCYSDSATQSYEIAFDPELLEVKNYADTYTYTGLPIRPEFEVTTPSGSIIRYNPQDVVFTSADGGSDCTNIGAITAVIPVTFQDETFYLEANYEIIPRNINTCSISQLANNTYTGIALMPPAILQYQGKELRQGLEYTVSYANNVNPGVADAVVTGTGNYTGTTTLHFNIVSAAVINLKAAPASESAITLTWARNNHVTGYEIYSGDSNTRYGSTTGNSYTVTGLKAGNEYQLKVRSYVTINGQTSYGEFKSVKSLTNVASTSITVKSIARGRASINWSTGADVNGYEIYRSTSAEGTYSKIAVMPKSAGGYTDSGLTSGATYYYKVRAYKSVNGSYVYGAYSAGMAITVR